MKIDIKESFKNPSKRRVAEHTILIGKNKIWIDTSRQSGEDGTGQMTILMDSFFERLGLAESGVGTVETLVKFNEEWLNYTMTRAKTVKGGKENHENIVSGIRKEGLVFLQKYRGNVHKKGDIFYDVKKFKEFKR